MASSELTSGLTTTEAARRLKFEGFNELPRAESRTPLRILVDVVSEPMLGLILTGAAIYLLLGDWKEAIILFFAVQSWVRRQLTTIRSATPRLGRDWQLCVPDKIRKKLPRRRRTRIR